MVFTLDTGNILPQYHVVFDNTFSAIFSGGTFTKRVWDSFLVGNIDWHDNTDTAPDSIPWVTALTDFEREIPQHSFCAPPTSSRIGPTDPQAPSPFTPGSHVQDIIEVPLPPISWVDNLIYSSYNFRFTLYYSNTVVDTLYLVIFNSWYVGKFCSTRANSLKKSPKCKVVMQVSLVLFLFIWPNGCTTGFSLLDRYSRELGRSL